MLLRALAVFAIISELKCSPVPGNPSECVTSPAVVGGSGHMTFHFRNEINVSSALFHAYVIKTGDKANAVTCAYEDKATDITCIVLNSAFEPTTIADHSVTLTMRQATQDLVGNYTLTLRDGQRTERVRCQFEVHNKTQEASTEHDSDDVTVAVSVTCVLLVLSAAAVALLVWWKRRRPDNGEKGDTVTPMLLQIPEKDKRKIWYFENLSQEAEAEMALFHRNGPGAFLIRGEANNLLLAVLGEDRQSRRLRIDNEEKFNVDGSEESFPTLTEMVKHYRENDLTITDPHTSYGRLAEPFELKPTEEWYHGKVTREEEKERMDNCEVEGGFFVRDNLTFPSCYTLVVKKNKVTKHARITVNDDGYKLSDNSATFRTLSQLVEYYREHEVGTKHEPLGKLTTPCPPPLTPSSSALEVLGKGGGVEPNRPHHCGSLTVHLSQINFVTKE